MEIIDAQLHEIGPKLAWETDDLRTRHDLMTEIVLAWMDAVGVDKTVINPLDEAWGLAAVARQPERLAAVLTVLDSELQDIADRVGRLRETPGVVGLRVSFGRTSTDPTGEAGNAKFRAGAFEPLFAACERSGVPLFCNAQDAAALVGEIAEAHPTLRLIVDHMGMAQPPRNPRDAPPWKALPPLFALGRFPNVAVKLTGAPVFSDQPYPYADVWPHLHQILDAFGAERVMWASDAGRFNGRMGWSNQPAEARGPYLGKHTYAQGLFYIRETDRLSQDQKEFLLGGTVRQVLGWPK